ncbi:MAG: alpha/beta hydrolase [Dehalococcoidia bacterium]
MPDPLNRYVTIDGRSIHFLEWGNSSDPTVILLHGLFGNAHYWDFLGYELSSQYHIIAIDQRGHGDSQWSGKYGPVDYVSDLEEFVEVMGYTRFALIGHSMGGITAILYASRHPERVSSLMIVDIGPRLDTAGTDRMIRQMASEPEFFDSMEGAFRYVRDVEPFCSDAFIRHQLRTALRSGEDGKLYFKFDKALRQIPIRSPEWLWEHLVSVLCPALVIRGRESDILSREMANEMTKQLPYGSMVEIERAGHGVPAENPDAFLAEVKRILCTQRE